MRNELPQLGGEAKNLDGAIVANIAARPMSSAQLDVCVFAVLTSGACTHVQPNQEAVMGQMVVDGPWTAGNITEAGQCLWQTSGHDPCSATSIQFLDVLTSGLVPMLCRLSTWTCCKVQPTCWYLGTDTFG